VTDQPNVSADADTFEEGSRAEAVAAVVHHRHHPADPNVGVVRAKPGRHAILAGAVAAAVTIVGVVLLAIAIGGGR
jgi:hypothetical protein